MIQCLPPTTETRAEIRAEIRAETRAKRAVCLSAALLTIACLILLAACALPGTGETSTASPQFSPITQHSPVVSSGQLIEQTITQFCSAVHAGNYDQAYTYLSAHYKTTVTSASQIPTLLGQGRKLTDCADFGNGGFLKISGSQATDNVTLTYFVTQLGSSAQGPGNMSFAQAGAAWQIDGLTG